MKMSIDQIIDLNIKITREQFEQSGEVLPTFIIHSEKATIPIVAPHRNEEEKRMTLQMVRVLMIKYRAYAYSVCMEAWMKKAMTQEEVKAMKGQVKDQPDKEEALIINYVGYDRKEMHVCKITRAGGKATVGKPEKFDGHIEGRFFELLPPAELHEKPFTAEQELALDLMIKLGEGFGLKVQEVPLDGESCRG